MRNLHDLSSEEYEAFLRNDLATFVERCFYELNPQTEYVPGQYIDLICSTIDRCRRGLCKRLIINLPPRMLKSHIATIAFTAWLLGHDPSKQIISASYGQALSEKFSLDCRSLMSSFWYRQLFPGTVLSREKQAVNDFMTTAQGCRMATSVGGPLTGRGGDFLIIDDIIKPEDALSDTKRRGANEWLSNTLMSRLNSQEDGVIIIVMQRLHEEDLVGEVTERGNWEVLALPAIAVVDERYLIESAFGDSYFTRKAGEALHPKRFSVDTYRRLRDEIGEYNFQSQYQQSPTSREGGVVKPDWVVIRERSQFPKRFDGILQSWDTANKPGELNNYSVCTTWGTYDNNFYLLDVFREKLDFPRLKRKVIELYNKHQPAMVLIEDMASGISLIQELHGEIWGIEPVRPAAGSDKYMRFAVQAIKFENRRVHLPKEAPWLKEFVHEITGFPGSKYNDQVDSTSQALGYLEKWASPASARPYYGLSWGYETC